MSAPSQSLPEGTVLGGYTLIRTLGQGGFGITYLAEHRALGTQVVIKENLPLSCAYRHPETGQVLPSGDSQAYDWAVENFHNEGRTLAKLNHPNIVKVQHAFEENGTAYFVMPYIEGSSLDSYNRTHSAYPGEAWLRGLLESLLGALSYLHGRNLLHRDIKPSNILLSAEGVPLLIDFGMARQLISQRTHTRLESVGFTSIEQIQSHVRAMPSADIYSLGCTLAALITNTTPPSCADRIGEQDEAVPLAIRPELLEFYTKPFLRSIDKAMAVWARDRWQSADEWLQALRDMPAPRVLSKNVKIEPLPRRGRRKAIVLLLSAGMLGMSIAFAALLLFRNDADAPVVAPAELVVLPEPLRPLVQENKEQPPGADAQADQPKVVVTPPAPGVVDVCEAEEIFPDNDDKDKVVADAGKELPSDVSSTDDASPAQSADGTVIKHHVAAGETWVAIASIYGITADELKAANPGAASRVYPYEGSYLNVPVLAGSPAALQAEKVAAASPKVHIIKRGETLGVVARKYRTTVWKLIQLNGWDERDTRRLRVGQKIIISK